MDQKTRVMGPLGGIKKFDDIFSRVDTIQQRDRLADRRTPDDCSKDRAYAWRRAGKNCGLSSDVQY